MGFQATPGVEKQKLIGTINLQGHPFQVIKYVDPDYYNDDWFPAYYVVYNGFCERAIDCEGRDLYQD